MMGGADNGISEGGGDAAAEKGDDDVKTMTVKMKMVKMVKIKVHLLLKIFSISLFTSIEKGGTNPK